MKTYQEYLDEISLKNHNHYWMMKHRRNEEEVVNIMVEATELYASQYREEVERLKEENERLSKYKKPSFDHEIEES